MRIALLFVYCLTNWFELAYETAIWPILGWIFLPYTTFIYMVLCLMDADFAQADVKFAMVMAVLSDIVISTHVSYKQNKS